MAKVLGVGGVFFLSRDPRRLRKWYSRCLGIGMESSSGVVFMPKDMPQGALTVLSVFPKSTRYLKPSKAPFMINLVVDDLEKVLEQVAQGGGKPVGKIKTYPYGRFGWFLDPDDNKVELWEPTAPPRQRARKT
jgi:predicted enzyme related to lactoylglutathione lyase